MFNRRGARCPVCEVNKTALVSLVPITVGSGESLRAIPPHTFSVCERCYLAQFADVYPDAEPPAVAVAVPFDGASEG